MRKSIVFFLGIVFSLTSFAAESVDEPSIKAGDQWVSRITTEKHPSHWSQKQIETSVIRTNEMGMLISIKENGSTVPPVEKLIGLDWSVRRSEKGEEQVVSQPLKFPLSPGKSWKLKYSQEQPTKLHKSADVAITYKVGQWEEITTPAGKFNAIKIEGNGTWKAELEKTVNSTVKTVANNNGAVAVAATSKTPEKAISGRIYRVYWYAPGAKRVVKSIEESYGTSGTRSSRYTSELTSYKITP